MFYKLDKDGNYVGLKSTTNQKWYFQTEINIPDGMIKPKLVNEVWTETFEPEIEVPEKVPLWAFRQVLIDEELFDVSMDKINELPDKIKRKAINFLEYGNYIHRNSPTVEMLGQMVGKSKTEIDTLFINADKLEL